MTAGVKGWCPSLYRPMAAGDGLIARIKPMAGRLSAGQTALLAGLAARYGNGRLELTIRANWQVRGLAPEQVPPFIAAAVAGGLAHRDPAVETIRNVLCHPLGGGHLGPRLEAALAAAADLTALPAKFGFVVDDGDAGLGPVPGDIRLVARRPGEAVLALDGADHEAVSADPVADALALARLFLGRRRGARRMRDLVARDGAAALFAAIGLAARPALPAAATLAAIGPVADDAVAFGLPFGQIAAPRLAALAQAAATLGCTAIHLSPWRSLVLAGIAAAPAQRLAAVFADDVIAAPDDPRRQVVACTGRPLCASGLLDSRVLAAQIAGRGGGPLVHVSGCAKGCAHPGPATVTLVGTAAGIDLVRRGRAGDAPALAALDPAQALALARP